MRAFHILKYSSGRHTEEHKIVTIVSSRNSGFNRVEVCARPWLMLTSTSLPRSMGSLVQVPQILSWCYSAEGCKCPCGDTVMHMYNQEQICRSRKTNEQQSWKCLIIFGRYGKFKRIIIMQNCQNRTCFSGLSPSKVQARPSIGRTDVVIKS